MNENKNRHTVWLTDEAWNKVKDHYRTDNCLPRVLAGVLEGKLDALGGRIGKILFKLSVEEAIMAQVVAYGFDVGLDTLKKVRVNCIKDVKETNGEVDFEDAYKFQKRLD